MKASQLNAGDIVETNPGHYWRLLRYERAYGSAHWFAERVNEAYQPVHLDAEFEWRPADAEHEPLRVHLHGAVIRRIVREGPAGPELADGERDGRGS